MIAGTIARLEEPVDEPFESGARNGGLPALEVVDSQTTFASDDRVVQRGTAAKTVDRDLVDVEWNENGEKIIETSRGESEDITTDWVADPIETGLLAAESVAGPTRFDFPFGMLGRQAGVEPELLQIDVETAHEEWVDEDGLTSVWMVGTESDDEEISTSIQYHDAASVETTPTIGVGFHRPTNGSIVKGVMYESGYVAAYSVDAATEFVQFVEESILPYTYVPDHPDYQSTFDEVGDDEEGS